MPPAKHALLGASKANQWINCTPSVIREQKYPETGSSEAAAEGTLAHAVAEEHLRRLLAGKKVATSAKLKRDPLYRPAMEEYVDMYTTYVMEHYTKACKTTPDALLQIEEKVDFSRWVPEGFGTADCILIADGTLEIFDLKYGKGSPVDAVGNPQIRLYAAGAYESYNMLYAVKQVVVHIVQPRLDSISSETLSVEELLNWMDTVVKPAAELAIKGEGVGRAGDHCKWCRYRFVCSTFTARNLEVSRYRLTEDGEERPPRELSRQEIGDILHGVDDLTRWAKGVKDWALDRAINHGEEFPGWKVVEGRANRVISDETKAIEALDQAGFTPDSVTRIKGITELEEQIGKKRLAELLDGLLIKPQGKPVLAPESDKRPALEARGSNLFQIIDD